MDSDKKTLVKKVETPAQERKRTYIVPAVDRAIRILSLLKSQAREMTIAEISKALNCNKSSIYSILLTLEHHGLLARNPATKQYSLGAALLEYGGAVFNGFDIRPAAKPILHELAQFSGESVAVSVLRGTRMTLLEVEESAARVRVALAVGMTTPVTATSHGRAVLAYLPDEELNEMIRTEGLPRNTKGSITSPGVFRSSLEIVRKQGYVVECEEFEEGIAAISAPVFAAKGVIGAISIVFPAFKANKAISRRYGKKCAEAAARLSALLQ